MRTLTQLVPSLTTAAGLNALCGNPTVALAFGFAAVCALAWAAGRVLGNILARE